MAHVLRRTALGAALICVGVPVWQNQVVAFQAANVSGPELRIKGDVTGLEPGHVGALVLTMHNPGTVAVAVHRLSTVVRSTTAGCALSVSTWTGAITVPAGGKTSQSVEVRVAGPHCAGVTWALAYTAS
jgi:hypothetical protein